MDKQEIVEQNYDAALRISLRQLSEQVTRVDKEIRKRMKGSYAHHHTMAAIVQAWKQEVDAMERMLYGTTEG